jgi:SAM-dependent methyltransferase
LSTPEVARSAPHRTWFQTRYLLQIAREVFLTDRIAMNDRSHREHEWNFAEGPDHLRWQRVLELVSAECGADWGEVLEIGCSEGVGTAAIARYARRLVAGDISQVARERAALRMRGAPQVAVVPLDLQRDALAESDIVFAMDVLEFVHGRRTLERTIAKLALAVRPGGLLVVSMCRYPQEIAEAWWQRWVPEGADRVVPMIAGHPALQVVQQEAFPPLGGSVAGYHDHLIALFRKR